MLYPRIVLEPPLPSSNRSPPERDNHEYFRFLFPQKKEKKGVNTDVKLISRYKEIKKCKRLEIQITLFQTDSLSQDNHEYFLFFFRRGEKGCLDINIDVKLISRCKELKKCKSKIRTTVHPSNRFTASPER